MVIPGAFLTQAFLTCFAGMSPPAWCVRRASCTEVCLVSNLTRALQEGHLKEDRGPLHEAGDYLPIEMGHAGDLGHGKAPAQSEIASAIPPQIVLRQVLVQEQLHPGQRLLG